MNALHIHFTRYSATLRACSGVLASYGARAIPGGIITYPNKCPKIRVLPQQMSKNSIFTPTHVQKLDFYPNKCPSVTDPCMHGYIYMYIYSVRSLTLRTLPPSMGTAKNPRSDASRRDDTTTTRWMTTETRRPQTQTRTRTSRSSREIERTRLDSIRDSLAPVRDETDETG